MKISACVIVKDEAANLPRWLANMRAVADELVVVDTGSTDDTVALAGAGGARVGHFRWCDDFAAARNYALSQVTGDWVLMLDADEYIPEAQLPRVRPLLARYDAQHEVVGFFTDWLNVDAAGGPVKNAGYQVRIFRRLPELRFTRMIHEVLHYSGTATHRLPYVQDVQIYHTGYAPERLPAKLRRNLRLLQQSQAKYGGQPVDDYYFADCYYGLGEYRAAIAHVQKLLASQVRLIGAENHPYVVWLRSLLALQAPLPELLAVVAQAREAFPQQAEFPLFGGQACWQQGDYGRALAYYEQGLRLARAKPQPEAGGEASMHVAEEAAALLPDAYVHAARLYRWRGQTAQALQVVTDGLLWECRQPDLCEELLRLLAAADDAACIEALQPFYPQADDAAWLAALLQARPRLRRPRLVLYYQRRAGQRPSGPAALRAAGCFAAATLSLISDIRACQQLGQQHPIPAEAAAVLAVLSPQG